MLRTRMHWHQYRQALLARNVANADTPNFRPLDLSPPDFSKGAAPASSLGLSRTDPGHIAARDTDGSSALTATHRGNYDIRPSGNAVNLQDEMLKVAANQMDYQTATTLYSPGLNLIKTALGKG
jgi:flagellar basal-body rod protein FlgB